MPELTENQVVLLNIQGAIEKDFENRAKFEKDIVKAMKHFTEQDKKDEAIKNYTEYRKRCAEFYSEEKNPF